MYAIVTVVAVFLFGSLGRPAVRWAEAHRASAEAVAARAPALPPITLSAR
jgi:hypothetical protein